MGPCGKLSISGRLLCEHRRRFLAVEAFDERVLRRFAWLDEVQTNAFCVGLPGWMKCSFTPVRLAQKYIAFDVNSGP
jgi:hypothetical protein